MTISAIISSRIFILCIISLSTICSIHAYQGTKRIGSSGSFVQAKLSRQSISTYPSDHSRDSRHCNRLSLNAMSNRIRKDGYEQESRLYSISPITRPANLDLPPDYSMLQLGDVLSQRSVGHAAENAEYLRTRFPDLTEDKILKWLYKFPTLSVIETKDIVKAIALFEQEVPEVDLTYLIHQDTVGMEVLLSVLSTQSFLPQRQTIQQTMQLIIDPSTLIRRVPHILHERYWQRFTSHCLYLHNYLAFNQTDAVELIMRWPPILQVELDSTIKLYLQVLQDNKLPIKMKDFSEMITREPSILGHSDSFQKKVTHLIESYGQTWDLHYIVTSYPKIFLQEKHRLSTVYEVSEY